MTSYLIKLGQGMEEAARTKSDASGHFSFNLPDTGPHLIRAVHQGVTYHSMAPPGANSVDVQVFDVAKKLKDISVTADVMRFQAQGNDLQVTRLFAVNNTSNPPRTQMNDQNFEFYLPEGAQIVDSSAETAGGQPLKTDPVPQKEKNRYAFNFPLRPGQTLFQIGFGLPYSGELSIDPKSLYPAQHFVVMLPKTMQFSAGAGSGFESRANPREPSTTVQVASNTEAGQALNFKISGTGTLSEAREDGDGNASPSDSGPAAAGRDARPGGGLGPPIDAPDPLEKYRWYILGVFAVILAAGAVYITKHSRSAEFRAGERSLATITDFGASDVEVAGACATPASQPRAGPGCCSKRSRKSCSSWKWSISKAAFLSRNTTEPGRRSTRLWSEPSSAEPPRLKMLPPGIRRQGQLTHLKLSAYHFCLTS